MEGNLGTLAVHGYAVREGKGKWACCYEIRLAGAGRDFLLYRGELHGRRFDTESAAIEAARECGENEARRQMEDMSRGRLTGAERQELTRLRREKRQLEMEREILAKAAAWSGATPM